MSSKHHKKHKNNPDNRKFENKEQNAGQTLKSGNAEAHRAQEKVAGIHEKERFQEQETEGLAEETVKPKAQAAESEKTEENQAQGPEPEETGALQEQASEPEENAKPREIKPVQKTPDTRGTEQGQGTETDVPDTVRETIPKSTASSEEVQKRREYRKKRRMRNQILAYGALVVLIGMIAAGIVLGVKYLTTARDIKQEEVKQQSQERQQERVEEILASEESISIPETSEPVPVEIEPTFEEKLDTLVDEIIAQMSLEDKVAGLFFATPENITKVSTAVAAGSATQKALTDYPVGGLIYQSKNIRNQKQITEVLSNTARYAEESANHNIFLAVSEEGGDAVTVAAKSLGTATSSAADIGAGGDPEKAKETGNVIGEYLGSLGFNLDFAPVADLNLAEKSAVGKRSYGSEVSLVSQCVTAMMQGLEEKGILSAVVQFPGTGSSTAKTENGLSSSSRTAEEFRAGEFQVFSAAIEAGAKMIMVSHMSAPGLDESNVPCSMSETVVTGILRRELGFQGVIISEPMNRKAISDYYSADEAAVSALKAGCDMILAPEDFEKAYNGVLEAVRDGRISEERINDSLKRVYRIKYADKIEDE